MRLEEFKDYCKTITREEFLEDCEDSNFGEHELNCPGDTGAIELKNACGVGSCKYCWEEAVKDIKFKGEEDIMENSNKPKTYKTWEVIKMLSENPKLRFRDCSYETVVIVGTGKGSLGTSFLEVCESSFGDKTLDGNVDLESEWTLIQQEPVDFMTAVKSGKRIRIEHELLRKDYFDFDFITEYKELSTILEELGKKFLSTYIERIITEGKFYIEE